MLSSEPLGNGISHQLHETRLNSRSFFLASFSQNQLDDIMDSDSIIEQRYFVFQLLSGEKQSLFFGPRPLPNALQQELEVGNGRPLSDAGNQARLPAVDRPNLHSHDDEEYGTVSAWVTREDTRRSWWEYFKMV